MKYRAEVDGLRALAVLPVVFFHAGLPLFSGGFVGVDIFFVISGYLITSILIGDLQSDNFSLVNFYERRARRIIPALALVVFVSTVFAWLWLTPQALKSFGLSLIGVGTFSSNFVFWYESGYFDVAAELKPLLHTWSLAVEEQYYVLFPLFMLLMWRFGLKILFAILLIFFFLSIGLAQWSVEHSASAGFYLLPARGWELVIGALCAIFLWSNSEGRKRSGANILSLLGFILIIIAVFTFDSETPIPGVYALVPTLGAALVIIFAGPGSVVYVLLSNKIVVGIGLISYSTYLWHQPLFAFTRIRNLGELSGLSIFFLCSSSLFMGYLSWRFVEAPFRNKLRVKRGSICILSIFVLIAFVVIGLWISKNDGFQGRKTFYIEYNNLNLGNYIFDNEILREESWSALRRISGDREYGLQNNPFDDELWFDSESAKRKILVVGNSHSKDIYNLFSESRIVQEGFDLARYGIQIRNIGSEFYDSPNFIAADIVVLASRYTELDLESLDGVVDRVLEHGKDVVITHRIFEFYFNSIVNSADQVVIENYKSNIDVSALTKLVNDEYTRQFLQTDTKSIEDYEISFNAIENIAKKHPEVNLLDRMLYVCPDHDKCHGVDQTLGKLFYDYGHHTLSGALYFAKIFDDSELSAVFEFPLK